MKTNIYRVSAWLLLAAAVLSLLSFASCGVQEAESGSESETTEALPSVYTLNDYLSTAPANWNPHEYKTGSDTYVWALLGTPLYGFSYGADGKGSLLAMAAYGDPIDITGKYEGSTVYGIPSGAKEGYAYAVKLDPELCWSDGSPVTAASYVNSAKQLLNPDMKNSHASELFGPALSVANAEKYYNNDKANRPVYVRIYDGNTYAQTEDAQIFASFKEPSGFFGNYSAADYYNAGYVSYFCDSDGNDLYKKYEQYDYIPLTDEVIADLTVIAANFDKTVENSYLQFCFYLSETSVKKTDWSFVGFVANGEYEIELILNKQISADALKYELRNFRPVKEDLYSAGKYESGGLTKTRYGTSVEMSASCGPYVLKEIAEDGTFYFERNEKWFGYHSEVFEGQYRADRIYCRVIEDHGYAEKLYAAGALDRLYLGADDMEKYAGSRYLYKTVGAGSARLSFNSDIEALRTRQAQAGEGKNKTILSYPEFRKAISYAIDREEFCSVCMPSAAAASGLISEYYLCDKLSAQVYRSTDKAKTVLEDVYRENTENGTGYSPEYAGRLFSEAYAKATIDGEISAGDTVELEFLVYNSDAAYGKICDFISTSIEQACRGTVLEGRIKIKLTPDSDYYVHAREGQFEIIIATLKGSSVNPYALMKSYCDPSILFEYGFFPTLEELTVNIDGTDQTKSYYDWYTELNEGQFADAPSGLRSSILAAMEKGIMLKYCTVPLYDFASASVHSGKVSYGNTPNADCVRYIDFEYDDNEWSEYCAERADIYGE